MNDPKLILINKSNIKEYAVFEKEYENNLKEFQTRIYPNNYQDHERLTKEKLLIWYYIETDDKLIGSIWLEKAVQKTDTAIIGIFISDETYRGFGIGEKVISDIISLSKQLNISKVELNVRANNFRAIICYKKCGFVETRKFIKNGVEALHMEKILFTDVKSHYNSLIDEENDPARDTLILQDYMDKWDGKLFIDELELNNSKDVLEIGVGTGRLAQKVCSGCKSFTGIDFSEKTIKRAEENLKRFTNKKLICADFMDYQFNYKYDVVYSSLTFMHFQNKQSAIEKIAGLLKPNGRFVLSIDKNPSDIIDMMIRKIKIYPDNPNNIIKNLNAANLIIKKQFETEFGVVFTAIKT